MGAEMGVEIGRQQQCMRCYFMCGRLFGRGGWLWEGKERSLDLGALWQVRGVIGEGG